MHGIFPWLCLTRGSDTIRALHHRMVAHRVVRPAAPDRLTPDRPRPDSNAVAAGD
ncbi:MAG: DUF6356 family protein [Reyranella sp.]